MPANKVIERLFRGGIAAKTLVFVHHIPATAAGYDSEKARRHSIDPTISVHCVSPFGWMEPTELRGIAPGRLRSSGRPGVHPHTSISQLNIDAHAVRPIPEQPDDLCH